MNFLKILIILSIFIFLSGCVLTKIITVPMRVGGAVISVIPVAGNSIHDAIDESAAIIDDLPL
ncbi:conserved exported hypothetical protein [Desulfamplus magnetovallimortis]|uniref:Lipoprotein n=1 Tax=Desulfamplus magnetovallimortis TaxID=1246637 RepID=A0A1W1H4F2_9BACT|nr:DUF6726 family protein [Desulfamplus magnetovallimortis]SLM27350.1 conserved exported hypothetical protein [Desulfamplus magnetovallimortis]